jgi:hypothetical protein
VLALRRVVNGPSADRHQRRARFLSGGKEKEEVPDASLLYQPPYRARRADDGKCALLASQHGPSAQQEAKSAGIQELNVAQIQHEHAGAVADRAIQRPLKRRHRLDAHVTPHGEARRSAQPAVDDLKRWLRLAGHNRGLPTAPGQEAWRLGSRARLDARQGGRSDRPVALVL